MIRGETEKAGGVQTGKREEKAREGSCCSFPLPERFMVVEKVELVRCVQTQTRGKCDESQLGNPKRGEEEDYYGRVKLCP